MPYTHRPAVIDDLAAIVAIYNTTIPSRMVTADTEAITVDHILAYTKGDKTSLKNAQPMHRSCNSSKGAR